MAAGHGGDDCGGSLLSLAEVLSISGVSKLVLHAWERRYGIEPTHRTDTGRRFYATEQAERLRLLKLCSDAGHRIGKLAPLPLEELRQIEAAAAARRRNAPLITALKTMDGEDFRIRMLARAREEGPEAFLDATLLPLLREIGSLWAEDALTIAAEHLATVKIKRLLDTLLDECPPARADAPRMITATLSGEEHEIGALAASLIARLHGWDCLYLGPNLPPEEVAATATIRRVRCVSVSAVNGKPARLEKNLRDLRAALPQDVMLVTGGAAHAALPALQGVRYLPRFDDFRQLLDDGRYRGMSAEPGPTGQAVSS